MQRHNISGTFANSLGCLACALAYPFADVATTASEIAAALRPWDEPG